MNKRTEKEKKKRKLGDDRKESKWRSEGMNNGSREEMENGKWIERVE